MPKGVKIDFPLQAYFRINAENMGQFERTLIIVDEGAEVHYVEGCTAPMYTTESLHSAVVEIIVKQRRPLPLHHDPELGQQHLQPGDQAGHGLRRRDDGVDRRQPRQPADDEVSGRLHDGAGRSRRDPVDRLCLGRASIRTPAPRWSTVPRTPSSRIISKSISQERRPRQLSRAGARSKEGATKSKSQRRLRRPDSRLRRAAATPIPTSKSTSRTCQVGHEASVSRIGEEQFFYLMSRGLTEAEASTMIVNGFIEPLVKELPMEYAVEMNRLIELQMEGSVG